MIGEGGLGYGNSLFRSDSESFPNGGLLEVARGVELLEFISRRSPSQSVVSIACQTAIGHSHSHAESGRQKHVRDAVEDHQALSHHHEGSRSQVAPTDASTVKRETHDEIAHSELLQNITSSGCIHLNWEGRALIHAIELLCAVACPNHAQRAKGTPG